MQSSPAVPVTLLLFASAREAAGVARVEVVATTVDEVLSSACARFGPGFEAVLARSRVWCNGEPVSEPGALALRAGDEVAVLPPVSGG